MSISEYQEEYEVIVYTRVRETYSVMAGSESEALDNWQDGYLAGSECVEILSEEIREEDRHVDQ